MLLLLGPTCAFSRGVTEGVGRYARERGGWNLTPADGRHAPQVFGDFDGIVTATLSDDRLLELERADPGGGGAAGDAPEGGASGASGGFRGVPVVAVGSDRGAHPHASVVVDNAAVGRLAAEHLLDRGFTALAGCGPEGVFFSAQRLDAFAGAVAAAGFAAARLDGGFPFSGFSPRQAAAAPVRAWLLGLPRPVGVFAVTDNVAMSLMRLCREAGLAVPEDVALVGVNDDGLLSAAAAPALSSVALPGERVGHEAAAVLDAMMERPGWVPPPRRLPPLGVAARQSTDLRLTGDQEAAAAYAYIEAHAHRRISAVDVCAQTRIARRSLERRFKRAFGRTLNEAILRVRLDRASTLLATTGLPVTRVAEAAGFGHMGHFYLKFKEARGATPQAFRARHRGSDPGATRPGDAIA